MCFFVYSPDRVADLKLCAIGFEKVTRQIMPTKIVDSDAHLYLIDASAYIFRAYHALPPLTRKSDGLPVGAVSGFCNMLFKLLEDLKGPDRPTHFACIFDYSGYTFRNEMYPEYKAHRPPTPEDLIPQFPIIRRAAQAFATHALELEGFEADDLIATYAKQAEAKGARVTIVSSDKDLMQLVSDKVSMLDTMKNKHVGPDEVFEKFGVGPDKVIDIQALAGDSADNVPGAPGIGPKTAAELINTFGDVDTLLARATEIKQPKRRQTLIDHADAVRISRDLVTLRCDVEVPLGLDELAVADPDPEILIGFLEEMQFQSITRRVREMFGAEADSATVQTGTFSFDADVVRLVNDTDTSLTKIIEAATLGGTLVINPIIEAGEVCGLGLCWGGDQSQAAYIPIGENTPQTNADMFADSPILADVLTFETVLDALAPALTNPAMRIVGADMKPFLKRLPSQIRAHVRVDDVSLLSFALHAGQHKHDVETLAHKLLDYTPIPLKSLTGAGRTTRKLTDLTAAEIAPYATEGAVLIYHLWHRLFPTLAGRKASRLYHRIEAPLVGVLADMELAGIKIDAKLLSDLSVDFATRMATLEALAHEQAGAAFNLGSPKQLGEILFGELGLPGGKKTKTGAWSTGADTLDILAADGHVLPQTILDWRTLSKLRSTYTEALQTAMNPHTGRVHTTFSMTAAQTGRLSSVDPNLQNIPIRTEEGRKIRTAFIPETGHTLISADYSQVELRLLAHIAQIDTLIDAFAAGHDIHAMTASEMFGEPIEGMDPMLRRRAKAINFGIIYGISGFGLARQLGIERSQASEYIKTYKAKFPGITQYMEDTKAVAAKQGYVETVFGRRIHLKGINDKGPTRAFAERQAINAPIQGSAADIIKRAMINLQLALKTQGYQTRMLLQIHDELVFEAPMDEAESVQALIVQIMQDAAKPSLDLLVPLKADIGFGANWGIAH